MRRLAFSFIGMLLLAMLGGCSRTGSVETQHHADHADDESAMPSNRINIPPAVRSNLGITFAQVERRAVTNTLRVPGRFELQPKARRKYHAPLAGHVELLVDQYQRVEPGQPLFRIESPQWRELQREIADAQAERDIASARLEALSELMKAHELHEQGLRESLELWTSRVEQLEALDAAGGGRSSELAEARASLTTARAAFGEVREKDAELSLRHVELASAIATNDSKLSLLIDTAAALTGIAADELRSTHPSSQQPLWRTLQTLEIRATAAGVVELVSITDGAWVEQGDMVLSMINPQALRFRAVGLQSDLWRLEDGLPVSIVPAQSPGGQRNAAPLRGTLSIGLSADPQQRTIDLLIALEDHAAWAREGVAAFAEIILDGGSATELAIPLECVVRDGLAPVIFRRDPRDPDKIIRLSADLGSNDGRWVEILSGVREGDEIVLGGVHQLLMVSSEQPMRGGHFHADGTWHADH